MILVICHDLFFFFFYTDLVSLYQTEAGLLGQAGDNVRDPAGRDYRPERGPVLTPHRGMAGKSARDPLSSIKTVYCKDVQVTFAFLQETFLVSG